MTPMRHGTTALKRNRAKEVRIELAFEHELIVPQSKAGGNGACASEVDWVGPSACCRTR